MSFLAVALQWSSGLLEGAEGQVFQHAMFGTLTMLSMVLMAMSSLRQKATRCMAVDEHVSRM